MRLLINIIYFPVLGIKFTYNPVTDIKCTPGHETCHQEQRGSKCEVRRITNEKPRLEEMTASGPDIE